MANKSPSEFHSNWPTVAVATSLPNVSGSPAQSTDVEVGDVCYVTGDSTLYQCTTATLGAAVWAKVYEDGSAIHDNVAGEIAGIVSEKLSPVSADLIIIEDSADGNNKKKVQIGNLPGGGGSTVDIRTHAIVVGNSVAGDTSDDCDYLDTGNGVQLQAALTAAGTNDVDVFIRRGTYDLGGAGASGNKLTIPAGVRVIGAGRGQTFIQTRANGGDGGAFFASGAGVEIENLYVTCPTPTAAQNNNADGIIETWYDAKFRRITIEYVGAWSGIADVNYVTIDAAFGLFGSGTESWDFVDCEIVDGPQLSGAGGSLMHGIWVNNGFFPSPGGKFTLRGFSSNGLERGIYVNDMTHCMMTEFYVRDVERFCVGIYECSNANITNGRVQCDGTDSNATGIDIANSEWVTVNSIYAENASNNGDAAIRVYSNSSYANISGCRGDGNWAGDFIGITGSSGQCIVVGNHANGDGITDVTGTSEIAHNF